MMKKLLFALAVLVTVGTASAAGKNYCGDLRGAYGPFDYRKRATLPFELDVVERVHFTPDIENGIKGNTGTIGGDLSYTLVAWPNHHRALVSMSATALRTKSVHLAGAKYPVECWFNRALRFAPDDGTVHAIYASYLFAKERTDQGFSELKQAADLEPENPVINYNLGLAYFKHKDYDLALKHAQKAYSLNYPLPGLKKKLIGAGKWLEPSPAQRAATAPGETPAPVAPSDKPAG